MAMPEVEMHEASPEFAECWRAAVRQLARQAGGSLNSWLRVHLTPPFLEHLSFGLGNQVFFIRITDADGHLQVPGNP
jgi:hypothetical protein